MRPLFLLVLLLATSCAPTRQPDIYHAPRRAQRYYEHRQRLHERERDWYKRNFLDQ